MNDSIVIGGGLAGLVAALRLAQAGASVTLVTKGGSGLQLAQGTLDIWGYNPTRVLRPLEAVAAAPAGHPYAGLGADAVGAALVWLRDELGSAVLTGDPAVNLHLPTAVGAIRPTALVPPSMAEGDVRGGRRYAVAGVRQLKDFQADLIAGNLTRSTAPDGGEVEAAASWIDLPARPGEADPSGLTYARALDDEVFADRFAGAVARAVGDADVVLVPAVLGVRRLDAWRQVADRVGRPVAEVALQPPSVPGLRLHEALLARVKAAGVRHVIGSRVTAFESAGDRLTSVTMAAAGGPRRLPASDFVYAPGGFASGALSVDSRGTIAESLFGLPLTATDAASLAGPDYWAPHRLFEVGVTVDAAGRPGRNGDASYANLYAAGDIIAGPERWREKTGDGLAVATAVRAADSIVGGRA